MHLAVGSIERSTCSHHGSTMNAQPTNVLLLDWRRNIGEPGMMMTERNGLQALKKQSVYFRTKEQLYWSARIPSNSSLSRKLWQDLDLLMRKSDSPTPSSSDTSQAESFSITLLTRSTKLDEQSMVHQIQTIPYTLIAALMLSNTTTKEVKDLIITAPNNYCLLDPVPTSLVKNCASLLAPYMSHLFNRSLAEGYIHASHKVAVVKTTFKETWSGHRGQNGF